MIARIPLSILAFVDTFAESLLMLAASFLQSDVTSVATRRFEYDIERTVREFARSVVYG